MRELEKPGTYYEYAILSCFKDVETASKTKYFPVTLAEVFKKIKDLDGKVAITGVSCFVKAIRLAQHRDLVLRSKITFVIGIFVGESKVAFLQNL